MQYHAPDDRTLLTSPTLDELERELRDKPFEYWQLGSNGEAILDAGPGEPSLWIKQPEPGKFFLTYSNPSTNWLVPYDGGPCELLVWDERGGDPFPIPRACLVSVEQAVSVIHFFWATKEPTPVLVWRFWHELPLTAEAIRWTGG